MFLKTKFRNPYGIFNLIMALILISLIAYFVVFPHLKHPIQSIFTQYTNLPSISTGLTRSLNAMFRGNIPLSHQLNPLGLRIGSFLIIQIILRISLFFMVNRPFPYTKATIVYDTIFSCILFLLTFGPMIIFTIRLLNLLFVS